MSDTSLQSFIDKRMDSFQSIAPPHIKFEAEKCFAIQILTNNPYLMKVSIENKASLAHAISNVAAIGLSLNPAEKQAYLIPRNVKEGNTWVSKVFLEPSYMGLCKLATDSGSIEWVQANCVYANDEFIDNGPGDKPTHKYQAFSKDRGDFVGVYCTAKTSNGDYLNTLMDSDDINGIMQRSETGKKNKGPWVTDFSEQAKKTVVRRASKMWPKTNKRLMEAVHISNENEGFEPIFSNPNIKDFTGEQKSLFDQYIEKNDALGMYVFSESFNKNDATSEGASVWLKLMHSFEKGSKGKYQALVNSLIESGRSLINEYLSIIEESIGVDDSAVLEVIEELDQETIKLIESRLNSEMIMEFNRIRG